MAANGVSLFGRELQTGAFLYRGRSNPLPVDIRLTYRSRCQAPGGSAKGFDGWYGESWDCNYDQRIVADGTGLYWLPGDGHVVGRFTAIGTSGGKKKYDSPAGVFWQLEFDTTTGIYELTNRASAKLSFLYVSNFSPAYLSKVEDAYSNAITIVRYPDQRIARVWTMHDHVIAFNWWDHERLRSITQPDGRETRLQYDSSGRLTAIVQPSGEELRYGYTGTISRMLTTISRYDSGSTFDLLYNQYDNTGSDGDGNSETIDEQWTADSMSQVSPASGEHGYRFEDVPLLDPQLEPHETNTRGVLVTDPVGAESLYGMYDESYSTVPALVGALRFVEQRSNLDQRATDRPSNAADDPFGWRTVLSYDPANLLPGLVIRKSSASTSTWSEPPGVELTYAISTYTSARTDPRLRGRIVSHETVYDHGQPDHRFIETWTYGASGDEAWPTVHESLSDEAATNPFMVTTLYAYDAAGQLLSSEVAQVTVASGAESYSIKSRRAYDSKGRLEFVWTPHREALGLTSEAEAAETYEYFDSGLEEGLLEKVTRADATWESYTYDVHGNMLSRSTPSSSGVNTWTYVYDDHDRQIEAHQPDVVITLPGAGPVAGGPSLVTGRYTSYEYHAEGLYQTSRHRDGAATLLLSQVNYDSRGRVESREQTIDTGITSKTAYTYDTVGRTTRSERLAPTGEWYTSDTVYDERGLALKSIRGSRSGATPGPDTQETWHAYDVAGRQARSSVKRGGNRDLAEEWDYDLAGRLTTHRTTEVTLSPEESSPDTGVFETRYLHVDGASHERMELQVEQVWFDDGMTPTMTTERSYGYDQAGRSSFTKELVDTGDYAYHFTDLYPGGQTKRSFRPIADPTVEFHKVEWDHTELDDFGRTKKTYDAYVASATFQSIQAATAGTSETEYAYNSTTGWQESATIRKYDDVTTNWIEHVVSYEHDGLGRLVRTVDAGTDAANSIQRVSVTLYDPDGQVLQSYNADADGSTETQRGVVTQSSYTISGQTKQVIRGLEKVTADGDLSDEQVSTTSYTYDLLGQRASETREGGTVDPCSRT